MGVVDRFALWWLTKASAVQGAIAGAFGQGQPVWTQENYEQLAREGYKKSVYVFRSVNMVAQACGGIPLRLERIGRDGTVKELTEHPLLTLLKKPNPQQGGAQFIGNAVVYRLLSGNTYFEAISAGDNVPGLRNPPRELYTLRPDRMRVIAGDAIKEVSGYDYRVGGQIVELPTERILHWKTFNPLDDWYGMSPLVAAARSVDQNNAAKDQNVAMLQNGARPSGALLYEGALQDNPKKNLLAQIKSAWAGARNAGKILLLEKGMSWQQMALSPVDLDFIEGMKLSADEIVMAFGVPMVLLKPTDATFSNMEEARRSFYQDTVLPLMDVLLDELNRWLVPFFGNDLRLSYDEDKIEALQEQRDAVYKRTIEAFQAGLLRLNEARSAIAYDDDPDHGHLYGWQLDAYKRWGFIPTTAETVAVAPAADPSAKAIGPGSAKAAADDLNKRREPYIKAVSEQVVKLFEAERELVKEAIGGSVHHATAITGALDQHATQWHKLMEATYLVVGEDFAKETIANLTKAARGHERKDDRTDAQVFADIRAYMQLTLAGRLQKLHETTQKRLTDAIAATEAQDGETPEDTAKRAVDEVYDKFTGKAPTVGEVLSTRSMGLAADWVVNASGVGSSAGATASGLPLIDVWQNTGDKHVRPTHVSAGGQRVKHGHTFTVGGASLLYPGDRSHGAPGSETDGCRCFVVHELDQSAL